MQIKRLSLVVASRNATRKGSIELNLEVAPIVGAGLMRAMQPVDDEMEFFHYLLHDYKNYVNIDSLASKLAMFQKSMAGFPGVLWSLQNDGVTSIFYIGSDEAADAERIKAEAWGKVAA